MSEPLEPLVALSFAAYAEPILIRKLAAELVRRGELEAPGTPIETLRKQAKGLVRRAAVPCGRRRRVTEDVLAEAARQCAMRQERAESRLISTARFDMRAAREALAEARRCRDAGIEVQIMGGFFRVRAGKGWRPISWRRVPS